ncbi:MAG: S1 RNA-binding domain-containing protein [Candidatus Promineofilum sp.]|uniref:30S ribosomal protein S1 n=1 Tax=Promineifilum sp. TaxID=2664178 RepID=UPI0024120644|nr:S1 RNA-binding domain-containing protein [Promineifilum sp.]
MSEESMHSLEDLLDQHDYDMPQAGDIRTGVIVANTPQGLIIDLGLKRDGIVPQSDLSKLEPEERDSLKVNDEVPVYVVQTEDPEALVVSIHLARLNQDWIEAEALLASGEIFEGEVIGYNKGGVIVPYGRIRGFVPISHLSDVTPGMGERRRQQRLARVRGEMIGVKIIEVDRHRHRLVMSQREAQREWEDKKRGELMETLQPGETRIGRVSGMRDFGAFVDLGGADGLVHISELSWHRIDHPREVVKLGDEIEVYVLGVDKESGRISLSRKKLLPNPWDTVAQRYVQNQLVEGKITRILDYGAFAEIEPGVEGLLHISQLSRNPVEDPRAIVKEGDVHLLRVVSIDQKRQRIGLSLKAVTATEQIEWMAQKEIAEALRLEEEEAAAAARGPVHQAEPEQLAPAANEDVEEAGTTSDEAEEVIYNAAELADEAVDSAADMADDAADAVEETVDSAGDAADEMMDAASDAADSAVDTVEDMADDAADAVEETVDSAGDAAETLVDKVQETAADVVDAAKDAVGSVVDTVETVIEKVTDSSETTEGEAG